MRYYLPGAFNKKHSIEVNNGYYSYQCVLPVYSVSFLEHGETCHIRPYLSQIFHFPAVRFRASYLLRTFDFLVQNDDNYNTYLTSL